MDGKVILLESINKKLDLIKQLKEEPYIKYDMDMIDLLNKIDNSADNLAYVSDDLIDYIKYEPKEVKALRDLFVGKKDYSVNFKLNDKHRKLFDEFREKLKEDIESNVKHYKDLKNKDRLEDLLIEIEKNSLINDYDVIIDIVKDYNQLNFDKNMISVMEFIVGHNEGIYNSILIDVPEININLSDKRLDSKVLDVLSELKIDSVNPIVLDLLYEVDVDEFVNNYLLIKKNKVEQYGILHLLNKKNSASILSLLCLSDEDVIMSVVDSVDKKANLVKILLNNCISVFFSKHNKYFTCNHDNYIKINKFLYNNEISKDELILRNPLFMLSNAEILFYAISTVSSYGVTPKKIVSKCYKLLSYEPMLLVKNLDILKKYDLDIEDYLNKSNYNLLKINDLESKIKSLKDTKFKSCDKLYEILLDNLMNEGDR